MRISSKNLVIGFVLSSVSPALAEPLTEEQRVEVRAIADAAAQGSSTSVESLAKANAVVEEQQKNEAMRKFGGVEFGVGFSFTLDRGGRERVKEAELVDGIVRVKDQEDGVARIMLESHFFFTPPIENFFGLSNSYHRDKDGKKVWDSKQFGIGPFIAIQPGTDDVINAVGIGLMLGFRHDSSKTQSFNLGIGLAVDPNARTLGDGVVSNKPLPGNETEIRYKEEYQTGWLVLASFSF